MSGGGLSGVAAVGVAALLASCASPERAAEARNERAVRWGDRTVAMTYRSQDPIVAYFAPAEGQGGALYVWDGGEPSILRGSWRIDEAGRVCTSLNVYRRETAGSPPLRSPRPNCVDGRGAAADRSNFRGDLFGLNGKSEPPYILSIADKERLETDMAAAERIKN